MRRNDKDDTQNVKRKFAIKGEKSTCLTSKAQRSISKDTIFVHTNKTIDELNTKEIPLFVDFTNPLT